MKRLISAVILALLIHIFFFRLDYGWLKGKPLFRPKIDSVSITLVQIKKEPPRPVLQKPVSHRPVKPDQRKVQPNIPKQIKKEKAIIKPPVIQEHSAKEEEVNKTKLSETENAIETSAARSFPLDMIQDESNLETPPPQPDQPETVHIKTAAPLYKENPRPEYPRLARRRGYQGTVMLDVLVDQDGRVSDLKIAESSGYSILDKKAVSSVKKWIFQPGKKGDHNIAMWVKVPIRFELK